MKVYVKSSLSNAVTKKIDQAEDPNTSVEMLKKLSEDKNQEVKRAVASNPNVTPEILAKLANDRYAYVRIKSAVNPRTPVESLMKLAKDRNIYVRMAAIAILPDDLKDQFFYKKSTSGLNKWEKAIKKELGVPDNLASVIYAWYNAEGAFEDFSSTSEFASYLANDIYDMLDACTDEDIRNEIRSYLN